MKTREGSLGDEVSANRKRPNARLVEQARPAPAALRKKLRRLLDMVRSSVGLRSACRKENDDATAKRRYQKAPGKPIVNVYQEDPQFCDPYEMIQVRLARFS